MPVVQAIKSLLPESSIVTADAGYHSEQNFEKLAAIQVQALIADNGMRERDERFATQERHKARPRIPTAAPFQIS